MEVVSRKCVNVSFSQDPNTSRLFYFLVVCVVSTEGAEVVSRVCP